MSSQGSRTGQLDFCNWLADAVRRDNVISIMLRQESGVSGSSFESLLHDSGMENKLLCIKELDLYV